MNTPGELTHDSELCFLAVAEQFDTVLWIVAPDGTQVHYVSPAYERVWGRSPVELYAAPLKWMQAIHPDDQAGVFEQVTHEQAKGPLEREFRIHRADGSLRYIRARSVPIRDADGNVSRVACLSEDITEQKQQMMQSEAAAHAQRDALVREVHHRIKNNLQGVTGLLRNYAGRHPSVAEVLNEAIAQVQAVAIIHGLHGQSGGSARVYLGDLLERVVAGVSQLMHREITLPPPSSAQGCEVVISEQEAVPVALVLNELVFNALKHGNPRSVPCINLAVDLAEERVALTISNDGYLPDRRRRPRPISPEGSGLTLVRSLLPRRGAHFELTSEIGGVDACLSLEPPVITLRC
jgi:PAS domain S-box-containing protein